MKKKNQKRNIGNCVGGHDEKDVLVLRVSRFGREPIQRYKCRRCKRTMDVPNNGNLIGNPFGIKQRTQEYHIQEVLEYVDRCANEGR